MSNQSTSAPIVPQQETVEYRDIPGFPGYRAGNDGTIWSCWRRIPLNGRGSRQVISSEWHRRKPSLGTHGYLAVPLRSQSGKMVAMTVHRAILESFAGPCPVGMEACHCDGNRLNNASANLRWDTRTNNHADKKRHGTQCRGEAAGGAILTEQAVLSIKDDLLAGWSSSCIGKKFGVTGSAVVQINNGKAWAWLTGASKGNPIVRSKATPRLKADAVAAIVADLKAELTISQIATKHGIDRSIIAKIQTGRNYQSVTGATSPLPVGRDPKYKLTHELAAEIKRRLANGESRKSVAAAFGVKENTVTYIALGKRWVDA